MSYRCVIVSNPAHISTRSEQLVVETDERHTVPIEDISALMLETPMRVVDGLRAAMRAINAVRIANFLTATRKISFDTVVRTMYETGRDLSGRYRETAEGGLAKNYRRP